MYKCKECERRFSGGVRRHKSQVITDYVEGKQTLNQLAIKYDVSSKTISRDLGGMRYVQKISKEKEVTIQKDHDLLVPELWPDGHQRCVEEEDPLAEVRDARDDSGLHEGCVAVETLPLDASKELLELVNTIAKMDKESFVGGGVVRAKQGCRQRAFPRQTNQEENPTIHVAQATCPQRDQPRTQEKAH